MEIKFISALSIVLFQICAATRKTSFLTDCISIMGEIMKAWLCIISLFVQIFHCTNHPFEDSPERIDRTIQEIQRGFRMQCREIIDEYKDTL